MFLKKKKKKKREKNIAKQPRDVGGETKCNNK